MSDPPTRSPRQPGTQAARPTTAASRAATASSWRRISWLGAAGLAAGDNGGYSSSASAARKRAAASAVGDVVKIPVLSVGASIYSLDLQLIPSTDPVQLVMIAAQEITLSEANLSNASSFANNTLTIPTLTAGNASYRIELILVSAEPSVILQLSKVDLLPAETNPSTNSQPARTQTDFEKAEALFNESIAQPIVQSKCISCHRQGRSAGGTSLVFVRSSATSQGINIAAFEALLQRRNDGINYILRKVSGNGHGGGTQLAAGSASYNNLSEFLTLLSR